MGLFSDVFGDGGASVPPMGPEERAVLSSMTKLAEGDPELGQMYVDFTKRALKGEVANPYLEKQLQREVGLVREDIARRSGALGDIASTAGIETMGRLREAHGLARAEAAREDIGLGERLLASRTGRLVGAGQPVLGAFGRQREMEMEAQLANLQAGGGGLAEMLGGGLSGYITGRALGVESPWLSAAAGATGAGGVIPFMKGAGGVEDIYGGGRVPMTTTGGTTGTGTRRFTINPEGIGLRRGTA